MPDHNSPLPEMEQAPQSGGLVQVAAPLSLGAAVAALFAFSWVAEEMLEGSTRKFDLAVRSWVHQFASPTLTSVMQAASFAGSYGLVAMLVVALAAFAVLRWWRAFFWLVATMGGALALDVALKFSFHRPRPEPFFGATPHSWSFPSGHALFSFCFYGVLAGLIVARIQSRPLRILIWLLAAALVGVIGLSRVYLGVHYPSDVLAGYLAATLWVSAMIVLDRRREVRRIPSQVAGILKRF